MYISKIHFNLKDADFGVQGTRCFLTPYCRVFDLFSLLFTKCTHIQKNWKTSLGSICFFFFFFFCFSYLVVFCIFPPPPRLCFFCMNRIFFLLNFEYFNYMCAPVCEGFCLVAGHVWARFHVRRRWGGVAGGGPYRGYTWKIARHIALELQVKRRRRLRQRSFRVASKFKV